MVVREAPHARTARLHRSFPSLKIPSARIPLSYRGRPLVMGILNVTPDSFSDGGAYLSVETAVARGCQMVEEGADLLDIGGESTRPGARPVPLHEELARVIPVVRQLAKVIKAPLSIDTSKAEVARQALDAGASIINDVTALRGDPAMASVVAHAKAAVILMHMRGTPLTMQQRPRYHDVVEDVLTFLREAAQRAQQAGIDRSRILIDPGLGFGKTVTHNLQLMAALPQFLSLELPIVIGPSRKSFIAKTLAIDGQDRLAGTLACVARAHEAGVHIVRVHDVRPTVQMIQMFDAIKDGSHATRRQY